MSEDEKRLKFYEGQELLGIFWGPEEYIKVGDVGCIKITVVMQDGLYGDIAWAEAEHEDGTRYMHSLLLVESIQLQ